MSQENPYAIINDETNDCVEDNLNEYLNEFKKREHVYLACISSLEKEICQFHTYLNEWRSMHMYEDEDGKSSKDIININSLRNILIDPSINLEIKELRQKIYEITRKCNIAEEKLQGCTFDAQATAGQRLINKCKKLQDENYELGKTLEENTLQPISIQIINLKQQISFYKNELKALKELNVDIDEDNELLSQQLADLTKKYTKIAEQNNKLEKKNTRLNKYINKLKSKLNKYDLPIEDNVNYKKGQNYEEDYRSHDENIINHSGSDNRENDSNYGKDYNKDNYKGEYNDDEYSSTNIRNKKHRSHKYNDVGSHRGMSETYNSRERTGMHNMYGNDEDYEINESNYRDRKHSGDEEDYTYENDDNYRKRSSYDSRERKYRKTDRSHHRDKKHDKYKIKSKEKSRKDRTRDRDRDKDKDRERERERDRDRDRDRVRDKDRDRDRDRDRNREKTKEKEKEKDKMKNKYKSKTKEKTKGKGKRDSDYDNSNYSESKKKNIKDRNSNDHRDFSRTDKADHSNMPKNDDTNDKNSEHDRYVYLYK
ncbi:conserved Plasmodium protein, unknown function [Plasmodium berghei]|uniref:Pre-mRNA-splicing regulator, putative n=2 Tax=Plasmodium berghei TaxID=5821 RepID=A0A509ASF6_PLABA|nr:pre-mRNA-splicing regulator, putative [Plasmodium berghei ANKA]SCM26783.1 conserved Plasmodium protein, unknown function [Plasmodium berghei]SCN28635.1 conserved Plasmodium protein, unknown function [Plasmodium berghei]SCO64383.1 conserved Plasmodium protein, unknown function [Plasmodium berghei]VUC58516.1 pre-mRNA-splicing regulator, putative [Plasmodium berghei ANKA]|eukprot:XP_034424279.1 pre-mRNA-splicing regulator, putative [Plasmodium berghei ANKA]